MLTNIKILYMYFLKSAFFIFKFIMTLLPYQHKYSCRLILTPAWHSIVQIRSQQIIMVHGSNLAHCLFF